MKKIKYRLRAFWGFSKKETNGFLILILIMVLLLAAPLLSDLLYQSEKISLHKDEEKLDSLVALLEKSSAKFPDQSKKKSTILELFYFNPNTEGEDRLKKLLGWKIARTIVRFRDKGGKFKDKNDLFKIYGIDSTLFNRLKKYILLPDLAEKKAGSEKSLTHATNSLFDINLADTIELQALKGIGKVLSMRIIKFRNKLGGFVSTNQFGEIYGLDSLVILELQKRTFIDPAFIPHKINVNTATPNILEAHPYIGKKYSKIIVSYRNQHHAFTSLEEVMQIPSIAPKDFLKMKAYLDL